MRMYKCQICGVVVPEGIPANHVVLETRKREYPRRTKVFLKKSTEKKRRRRKPDPDKDYVDDPGGTGFEIVRQAMACKACAEHARASMNL